MASSTAIPSSMKALRVNGPGQSAYSLENLPVPSPSGHQVLLRIGAAGLCHTDLLVLEGNTPGYKVYPVTASHEPTGTVVAMGEEAEKEGMVKVGQRVAALLPRDWCEKCPDCLSGQPKYCPNTTYTGLTGDGAFSEYAIYDSRVCRGIPDDMSFEQAAPLTCAGITIYVAIKKCNLVPGQVIAMSGLGALGSLGVQIAKAMGLKVVAIDARPEPIGLVQSFELKPDIVVDATQVPADKLARRIRDELRPEGYIGFDGADAIILTSDPLSAQRYAFDVVRRHGLFVLVAQPPKIEIDFTDFIFRDITMIGSMHGNEDELAECIELVYKYGIKSDVTKWTVGQHEEMLKAQEDPKRKGKSVLVFE